MRHVVAVHSFLTDEQVAICEVVQDTAEGQLKLGMSAVGCSLEIIESLVDAEQDQVAKDVARLYRLGVLKRKKAADTMYVPHYTMNPDAVVIGTDD